MARIRSIHPDVHADPKLAQASSDAWRLYFGIANQADDFGVCPDAPDRLRLQVFAARPDADTAAMLDELVALGKLARYVDDATGKRYLHCVDWTDEQRIDKPSTAKRYPTVASLRLATTPADGEDADTLARARECSRGLAQEGNRKGEEGRGEEATRTPADAGAADGVGDGEAKAKRPAQPRRKREGKERPWMSELRPVWRAAYGGDMLKGDATLLDDVIAEHDVPTVAAHLAVFCAQTPAPMATIANFVRKFGSYAPGGIVETSKPAQSTAPALSVSASEDELALRRDATGLYDTLRTLEIAPLDITRAGGMMRAALTRGTFTRETASALFVALYGADGAPPADGGALRKALLEGRARDAVPALERVLVALRTPSQGVAA